MPALIHGKQDHNIVMNQKQRSRMRNTMRNSIILENLPKEEEVKDRLNEGNQGVVARSKEDLENTATQFASVEVDIPDDFTCLDIDIKNLLSTLEY